jgi:hypothetical protein
MRAPIASGAGFPPAKGGRSCGAIRPGDAEVRAAVGVLSAKLRSSEYGLESQEGRRLCHRKPPVNGLRPAGQARANVVQTAGKSQGRLQGLTMARARDPIKPFRFAVPQDSGNSAQRAEV